MTKLGMDSAAVHDLAGRLDAQATALDAIRSRLEAVVRNMQSSWSGPDAQDFVGWWNEQHKPALTHARHSIAGLATSARNNADEQDHASSGSASANGNSSAATAAPHVRSQPAPVAPGPGGDHVAGQTAASDFAQSHVGKGWNYDGQYGNQCVDLFNYYNRDVVGGSFIPTGVTGGARDLYEAFPASAAQYYDKVPYVPGSQPHPGDVAIWTGASGNGGYGHVAIVTGASSPSFSVIEQDGNHPDGAAYRTDHLYGDGLLGFLRPKKFE